MAGEAAGQAGDCRAGCLVSEWSTRPLAARLRIFWKNLSEAPVDSCWGMSPGAPTSSLALVPAAGGGSRLTPSDRERFRLQLEKDYTSVVVTAETMPAPASLAKNNFWRSSRGAARQRRRRSPTSGTWTWWELRCVCSTSWRRRHTLSRWSMRATSIHGQYM